MNNFLEISNNLKNKSRCYPRNLTDVSLDEEKIFSQNYEAFKVMRKIMCNDVPKLEKLRKTVDELFSGKT